MASDAKPFLFGGTTPQAQTSMFGTANDQKDFQTASSPAKMAATPSTPTAAQSPADPPDWWPAPSTRYHPSDVVTLKVGSDEEEEEFVIHARYLTQCSEFFKAALEREWVEGQTRIVKLPEEEPPLFAQYLDFHWDPDSNNPYPVLAHLYVLGERLIDPSFQNLVLTEMIRISKLGLDKNSGRSKFPTDECITIIYNGTTEKSPARRLMVDFAASYGSKKWLRVDSHPAFLLALGQRLLERVEAEEHEPDFRAVAMVKKNYLQ